MKMLRFILICLCTFCVLCDLNLPEGSPCRWQGLQGQCVKAHKCFSTILNNMTEEYPPICTYQGKELIVCCTDCDLVDDTRLLLIDPALGILNKTGNNKAKDKCVDFIYNNNYPCKGNVETKIEKRLNSIKNCYEFYSNQMHFHYGNVGGQDARRAEYPHMALLGYGNTIDTADWLCGGSVISERFILTAAHCVYTSSVGPVKYVALGILKRTDPPETWERYNVKRITAHPDYKPPSKYNDIALLETDQDILFSSEVRPACLHVNDEYEAGAHASGWGALGHKKELADTLQAVYLHKFSEEECSVIYPPHRQLKHGFDNSTQLCYGDRFIPRDTCVGDSGGPLQSAVQELCVFTILGVTSFGRQCGALSSAGVYTRVTHYVPWIEGIVWP